MKSKDGVKPRKRAAPNFIDRETVTSAALAVFAERGFHGASMRQIAAEARTSLSNLYNYFGSKDELLGFVLEKTAREVADSLEAAVGAAGTDPDAQLAAAVAAYVDFIIAKPAASVVGITEVRYLDGEGRAEVVEQRDRTEKVFLDVLAAGAESGAFALTERSATARAAVTLCNSMSTWYRPDGPLDRDGLVELQVGLVRGLVRARD